MFKALQKKPAQQLTDAGARRPRLTKAPMYSYERIAVSRRHHVVDKHKQWAALGAWFLGPKAENGDVFQDLLTRAVDSHIGFRHR